MRLAPFHLGSPSNIIRSIQCEADVFLSYYRYLRFLQPETIYGAC